MPGKKPSRLSKKDRELLALVAEKCVGKSLFPEAVADAKRIMARVVQIGDLKKY